MNPDTISTSAATSPAPASGSGGAGSPAGTPPDPRSVLAAMLAAGGPRTPDTTQPPPSAASADPESPPAPAEGEPPGQNLTAEEPSPQPTEPDADTAPLPEGEGESRSKSSPPNEPNESETELAEVLKAFDPKVRASALELAKSLQPGEIPRIAALVSKLRQAEQTIEEQHKQIEEQAQTQAQSPESRVQSAVPPNVAKLKTMAEVEQRLELTERYADDLTDFLDAQPGDRETVYDISSGTAASAEPDGARYFTRAQLIAKRAEWRQEIKALPRHAQALARQTEFQQQRRSAREAAHKAIPQLADPESAEAQAVRTTLQQNPWLDSFLNPELEALIRARGLKSLEDEIKTRNSGKNGNGKPPSPFAKPPTRTVTPNRATATAPMVPPLKLAQKGEALDRGSFVAVLGRKPQ